MHRANMLFRLGVLTLLPLAIGCDDSASENAKPLPEPPSLPDTEPEADPPEAFETEDSRWVFVEDDDMKCMDGSSTGFGIRHNPDSKGLLVHLQDGGGCFNAISCQSAANKDGFTEQDFWNRNFYTSTLLNDWDSQNPFKDYTHVFVPYCSGDVFVGNTESGYDGLVQQGSKNVDVVLDRISHHMQDSFETVVLSGISAGGVGAVFNYEHAKKSFGSKVKGLISDSAPILDDNVLSPCLQETIRDTWSLPEELPNECEGCENLEKGGLTSIYDYLANKYKGDSFGLLGTKQDPVFRLFYSFGVPCTDSGLETSDFDFANGVDHFEARLSQFDNVHTIFFDTPEHGLLLGRNSIDLRLRDWVSDFESGL